MLLAVIIRPPSELAANAVMARSISPALRTTGRKSTPSEGAGLKYRIVRSPGQQHADAPHPILLLRTRSERPDGG
jgi:hypothetical protein